MYTVTASFATNAPASAANVNARRTRPTPVDTVRRAPNGRHLWIAGLPLTPGRDLSQTLDRALDGELADTVRSLTSLDGAFSAFVWDATLRKLIVVSDFAGLQPLYMRRRPGALAFAPTIRQLAAEAVPDPAGWGAFVGLGHFIAERTSVAGVTRVPGATVLEYEPDTDRLTSRSYWTWPDVNPRLTTADVDTGELLDVLMASIDAYAPYATEGTLLLSGGYESRLLSGLLSRAGRRPVALTLRNPYEHLEIDGRFAARVAREAGFEHVVRDPDPNFFSTEKFLEYVRLSDVGTTSVNLFIAQVYSELQAAGVQGSWDGVCYGTLIKDKSAASFEEFVRRILKRPESPTGRAARRVFAPAFFDAMWSDLQQTLDAEIARCHEGPAGVAEFFVRNRARNRTTPNALKVYANVLLPFMPGLIRAVYERTVPIPPAVKANDALYRLLIERHFPALGRLPYCTGGKLLPGSERSLAFRALAARSAVIEHPRVGNVLRRLGVTPARPESAMVTRAVRSVDAGDPILNADGVRDLQRTPPTGTNEDTLARELVFYWWMWRRVMGSESLASGSSQIHHPAGVDLQPAG